VLLAGKVALVTGGAGGIGAGITRALAEHGARVAVVDVDADRTAAVAGEVGGVGIVADVLDPAVPADVVGGVVDRLGRLDVLVNNVGHYLFAGRSFVDTDEEQWQRLHDVNLLHVLRMCQAAIPVLPRGGSIVNLTTVEAKRGIPHQAVYGAYKAAAEHFTRCLALDVAASGIRVNAIAPDVTRSLQLPYDEWMDDADRERVPRWVPLGRLGEPADCGGVAVFLASDLSGFVTGATIPVDGGTGVAGGWYRTTRGRPGGWTNRPRDP
jgi:NAD(P)-dependent dehydrogenase (short-subunit alcohol dehydrogenase family)